MKTKIKTTHMALIFWIMFYPGCGGSGSDDNVSFSSCSDDNGSFSYEVLGSGIANREDMVEDDPYKYWPYDKLSLKSAEKADAYALWIPPKYLTGNVSAPGPVVLMTDPYDDWDTVSANPGPQNIFGESLFFLMNDFGVLIVFGRFNKEDPLQNDLDDMIAGLRYLAIEDDVDPDHIGIYGGSWGGFESIYAASCAPGGALPKAGVALYPVTDFEDWANYYSGSEIPADTKDFLDTKGYVNRITATTGGMPGDPGADYNDWTAESLTARLQTEFLVVHDEYDYLIPYSETEHLVSISGGKISPVWYLHDSPPASPKYDGHGDLLTSVSGFPWSFMTLAQAYLVNRIASENQTYLVVIYSVEQLHAFVEYLKTGKDNSKDMEWAAERLRDLADPRVIMINGVDNPPPFGNTVVAAELAAVWVLDGSSPYAVAGTVYEALADGLPE